MAGGGDKAAWKRLGEMLERRRVEIDVRFANLALFAQERSVDYRLLWDIEHGARSNYRRTTLMALEMAYELAPGTIIAALAGVSTGPGAGAPRFDDPADQAVADEAWERNAGLPDDMRRQYAWVAVGMSRQKRTNGGAGNQRRA